MTRNHITIIIIVIILSAIVARLYSRLTRPACAGNVYREPVDTRLDARGWGR